MPFDWRATPQTAQMFSPQGVFAPFYMRQAQQAQVAQTFQQQQFQEKQQRAAFDYTKGMAEFRQQLQEMSPYGQAQLRGAESEAELANLQAMGAGRMFDLQARVRGLQEVGRYDEAADIWQAGQMPQAAEAPEMQYLLSQQGEMLAQVPGAFKVAREPAGAVGIGELTPRQRIQSEEDILKGVANLVANKELPKNITSPAIRKVMEDFGRSRSGWFGGKLPTSAFTTFFQKFAGGRTQQKQEYYEALVRAVNSARQKGKADEEAEYIIDTIDRLDPEYRQSVGLPVAGGGTAPGFGAGGGY